MNISKSTLKHMVEVIVNKNSRDNIDHGSKQYLIAVVDNLTSQLSEMNDDNQINIVYKRYVDNNTELYTLRCKECYNTFEQLSNTFEYMKQHRSKFDDWLYKTLHDDLVQQLDDARECLDEYQIQLACPLSFEDWKAITKPSLEKRLKDHSDALDKINTISKLIQDESFSKTVKFLGIK